MEVTATCINHADYAVLLFIVSLFAAAFICAGAFVLSLDLWFYDEHIVNIFELIYCGNIFCCLFTVTIPV